MSVRFDEYVDIAPRKNAGAKPSGIAGLIIRTGLVKNETGANLVMVVVIILALGSMFFLLPGMVADIPAPTPEQVILQ